MAVAEEPFSFTIDISPDEDDADTLVEASLKSGDLSEFLENRAAVSQEVVFQLTIAFDELTANVIKYAVAGRKKTTLSCQVEIGRKRVELVVKDNGPAFDPLSVPPPDLDIPLEERPIGGLGLHLVRSFFPDISYRRDDGWNVVRVGKDL